MLAFVAVTSALWMMMRAPPAPLSPPRGTVRSAKTVQRVGPMEIVTAPAVAPPAKPKSVVVDEPAQEDPKRAQIRDALAETFRARFPDRDPSDAELERMAEALRRMMAARDAMRALKGTPEESGERRRLRDALGEAVAEFEQVAEVPLSEVTKETGAGGISTGNDADEDVVFEPMEAP
jgi:hypothetical protein